MFSPAEREKGMRTRSMMATIKCTTEWLYLIPVGLAIQFDTTGFPKSCSSSASFQGFRQSRISGFFAPMIFLIRFGRKRSTVHTTPTAVTYSCQPVGTPYCLVGLVSACNRNGPLNHGAIQHACSQSFSHGREARTRPQSHMASRINSSAGRECRLSGIRHQLLPTRCRFSF